MRYHKKYKAWKEPIDPGKEVLEREYKKIYYFCRNYFESLKILYRFAKLHGYDNTVDFIENGLGMNASTFYKAHKQLRVDPRLINKISRMLHLPTRYFTCRRYWSRYWPRAHPIKRRTRQGKRKMRRYYNVEYSTNRKPDKFKVGAMLPDKELEQDRTVSDTHWLDQIE